MKQSSHSLTIICFSAISVRQSRKIMSTAKSKTDKSYGAGKAEKASAISNDAQGRINLKMVQNVLLVWLDSNIDENNGDSQNNIGQLRR